jgi:hypothetical protein
VEPSEPVNAPEPLDPLPPADPFAEPSGPASPPGPSPKAEVRDPLARIADALREITPVLDAADMEPDPTREDWTRARGQIDAAYSLYQGEVLPAIDAAFASIPSGSDLRLKIATNVAWIGAELAALLHASKRNDDAQRLLLRVSRFAPTAAPGAGPQGMDVKAEIDGAIADTGPWVELVRARFLQRTQQWEEGDRVLKAARSRATNAAVKRAIEKQLGGARPIASAPPLFRINGCGASIYGERDRRPDGSYVTTYCVCLLFVPVWPISAYRVVDHGNGSYGFMAKEPLSGFARGYRWVLAGFVALWIASAGITSWLNDPSRLARNAFEDTQARASALGGTEALAAWESLVTQHGYSLAGEQRDTAGREMVRLMLDQVASPMTAARASEAEAFVARYQALPELAHGPAQAELVAERLLAWQSEVGLATHESAVASLRILDAASRVAPGSANVALDERRRDVHRAMAEQVAAEWPLEAVEHWVAAGDPASVERAGAALGPLAGLPSLLLESEPAVSSYLAATSPGSEPRDAIALALDAARTMRSDEGRRLALESQDPRALEAVLRTYPQDQETIAALAETKRGAGDLAGAHALIDPLGEGGRLAGPAQLARANLLAAEGHLVEAESLLQHYVGSRLPGFQEAQRAYRSAFDERTSALQRQLEWGTPPYELESQLVGVYDEARTREIVQGWYLQQITSDASLDELRGQLDARSGVVPSVLALAMIELRLGNDTGGEARDGHFREAERLFLAIREQAEGLPSFHLGLGQVYHRLGRAAEGDAEIAQVVAMADPQLQLEAAYTYRELGLNTQASAIAQQVYDAGAQPTAGSAAVLLSLMAQTLEDEELWLGRADQEDTFVQINTLQARARRLQRDGDLRGADTLFGQVADRYLALGEHETAALNNAAIALQQRYACTGNTAHLTRARQLMEQAFRRAPESGLTASNLADLSAYVGRIAVLDRFVHTRDLRLDGATSEELLGLLLAGEQRDAVVAAVRDDASLRRALEVARQAQTLSPQRTDAYSIELELVETVDDAAAMQALEERVARVTNLETSVGAEQARRWREGELDATTLAALESAITTLRGRVDGLRGGHGPTFAAAASILAGRLSERGQLRRDVADFDAAAALLAEAEAAAPGLGARVHLGWSQLTGGLLRLSQSQPSVAAIVESGWRNAPIGVLCARIQADPGARAAVAGDAGLREAVGHLRSSRDHGVQTIAVAQLFEDAALREAALPRASGELARRAFAVRVRLAPWAAYAELEPLLR